MGVMMLAAECGSELEFSIDGPDEVVALETILELFKTGFSED